MLDISKLKKVNIEKLIKEDGNCPQALLDFDVIETRVY